jgi:hypothetical protein
MTHESALLNVWEPLEGRFGLSESSKGQLSAFVPSQCRTTEQKVNQFENTCFKTAAAHDESQNKVLKRWESCSELFR